MRHIRDYEAVVGKDEVENIVGLAERVQNAKVIHVNATSYGGGVAEILRSLVPLVRSLGLDVKWQILNGESSFFGVTKKLHNALHGDKSIRLTRDMEEIYLRTNNLNAETLDLDGDVIVIHDPQPLPLVEHRKSGIWVWRCHIDTSEPNPQVWSLVKRFVEKYYAVVFSKEQYIPPDLHGVKVFIKQPSIDPLSEKNKPIHQTDIIKVLERYDVDPDRPILGQVARFDPWKDPLGVINLYRKVKHKISDVQLLLIGSFADDDPEGMEYYRKIVEHATGLDDVHVLTNLDEVGNFEVNAFQRSFTLALQLSIREGFGLTVAEALWKGVPVIATRAGGIPLQVINDVTGFLVDSVEEAVERAILLLRRHWLRRELGQNGVEHIRRNFLITKDLRDYLRMHIGLVGK